MKLSVQDILSSDGKYPDRAKVASTGVIASAGDLATRLAALLAEYGTRPPINSGYRTPEANKAAGGAPKSAHLEGRAVDFADPSKKLSKWCLAHLDRLEYHGIWMEAPDSVPRTHLQSRPVKNRVFKP